MDPRGAGLDGRESVRQPQPPVAVAMPIHPYVLARRPDDLLDYEADQGTRAVGSGVAHRVCHAEPARSPLDRAAVQRTQRLGSRAHRVLGHEHDGQTLSHRERHRLLGHVEHLVERPVLGVLPDRGAPDEGAGLNREAYALGDLGDGSYVGHDRASGTVGLDGQIRLHDLAGEGLDRLDGSRPGPGKPDVRRVDAELVHEMEQPDLGFDGRVYDRGILKSVPQRLVIEFDVGYRTPIERGGVGRVPVVNEVLLVHGRIP